MVVANVEGDGLVRNVQYAKLRTDVPPKEGYSAELISTRVDPAYYDDLAKSYNISEDNDTLFKRWKNQVANIGKMHFLGTRQLLDRTTPEGKPMYGDYQWKTYGEVDVIA